MKNEALIRFFDITFSFFGIVIFMPIFFTIYLYLFFTSRSPLFLQKRVGKNERVFTLVKFRSMDIKTISVPTHEIQNPCITKFGNFLRKTKLDEIPQLYNVFVGHMSIVGPRPGLIDHNELIIARRKFNIYSVKPGITGLSQVNKIDMSNPKKLAESDLEMISDFNLKKYFIYIFLTILGNGFGDRVK